METRTALRRHLILIAALTIAAGACAKKDSYSSPSDTAAAASGPSTADSTSAGNTTTMNLTSPAFAANASMAAEYTCEGDNTSPPLSWSGAPANTKSFALIVEDPDAPDPAKPTRVVSHWVLYNIPAGTTSLAENASKSGLPSGAAQGSNERKTQVYMGPCPPIGRHRYFFKLYALDTMLTGLSNPAKADLQKAIEGHVLGSAELIGTYQKAKILRTTG